MSSSIQLLRSTTARERPQPGSLLEGQPALNLNAQEPGFYFKASDGSLVKVGPPAITVDGLPPNSSPNGATGNSVGELWYDASSSPGTLKIYNGSTWLVAGNGDSVNSITAGAGISTTRVGDQVTIANTGVTELVAGSNITLSSSSGSVTISATGGGGGGGVVTLTRWQKTAAGGEIILSGADNNGQVLSYYPGWEEVYINGVLQTRGSDYTATNGTSVALLTPLSANDIAVVMALSPYTVAPSGTPVQKIDDIDSQFNGSTQTFNLSIASVPLTPAFGQAVIISLGGVLQEYGVDFTVSGSQVTFTTAPAVGLTFIGYYFQGGGGSGSPTSSDDVTYTQGAIGSVTRTLTSRLQDRISVKDFGAVGNGVADDTAAIQAAVDAYKPFPSFATGGVEIYFPRGTYLLSAPIDLSGCRGMALVGAGTQVTELRSTGNFSVIRSINTAASPMADVTISDFTIRGGGNSLSNAHGIETLHTNGCTISNLAIYGCRRGLSLTSSWQFHVENVDAHGGGADRCDIGVYLGQNNFPTDPIDNAVTAYNLTVKDCISYGFRIINGQGSKFVSCEAGACGIGWYIGNPTSAIPIQWLHVDNCLADSCVSYNWLIEKGGATEISQLQFSNCWSGNTGTGSDLIKIIGANDLIFSNWQLIRSPDHCINIQDCTRISWSNFQCIDFNRSNSTKHAIRVHNSNNITFLGGMVSAPLYPFPNDSFIESGSSFANTFELPVANGGSIQSPISSYTRRKNAPVSVQDFGAVGNGVADDGPAIQRAIDFVLNSFGGEVFFPPGSYFINTPIVVNKPDNGSGFIKLDIALRGTSLGSAALIRSSTLTGPLIYVGAGRDGIYTGTEAARGYFSISNLILGSQGNPSPNYTDAHIAICGVLYTDISNLSFGDGGCNLWLRGVTQSNVSNCTAVWSNNSVSPANRYMVVIDKTPTGYGYQQLCGDLTFSQCNFRMGAMGPNVGVQPSKAVVWMRCFDGVWFGESHIQGGDYVFWLDNSELGVPYDPPRAFSGLRVDNCWLDLSESGGGLATATVYISGNQKTASGNWSFTDTVFMGGLSFTHAILGDTGNVSCVYGLQVDNCHIVGYREQAVKLNLGAGSNFKNFQVTGCNFHLVQAAPISPSSPIIELGNVQDAMIANNTATNTPGANRFLTLNSGTGQVQVTGNLINLPFVFGSSYANAILTSAGVSLYQFNNAPIPIQGSYANDVAAAVAGIPVGGYYRDGSTIKQRIS